MDRNQRRVLRLRNHVQGHNNKVAEEPTEEVKAVTNTIAYEGMTRAEMSELLTERGIEYNSRDNRDTLIELLIGSD